MDYLLDGRLRLAAHLLRFQSSHGVGNRYYGQSGHTQSFSLSPAQGGELIGAYGAGGNMPLLQLDGIVDTPRCARPSIANGIDHQITLVRKLGDDLFGGRSGTAIFADTPDLASSDNAAETVSFGKQLLDPGQKDIGIGLSIVQKTDPLPLKILRAGVSAKIA